MAGTCKTIERLIDWRAGRGPAKLPGPAARHPPIVGRGGLIQPTEELPCIYVAEQSGIPLWPTEATEVCGIGSAGP